MPIAKFTACLAAAALGLAAPLAYAQDAAPSSVDETNAKDVPACSATVTDHCMDKPGAHHRTAHATKHHAKKVHAKATKVAAAPPLKAAAPAVNKKM